MKSLEIHSQMSTMCLHDVFAFFRQKKKITPRFAPVLCWFGTVMGLCLPVVAKPQCAGGLNGGNITPALSSAWQTMQVSGDSYYTFNAVDGLKYDFTFCSNGGDATGDDTRLDIRTNADAYVTGNDDACGTASEILNWTAPASGVFRLRVGRYSSCDLPSVWTLAYRVQINDSPCDAAEIDLICAPRFTTYNNGGAGNSGVTAPTCGNYAGGDLWYKTTLGGTETVIFELQSGTLTDMAMAVYDGSCGALNLLACDANSGSGNMPSITLPSVAVGTVLWIRIWDENGDETGDFEFTGYKPNSTNCFEINGDAAQVSCNCYQLTQEANGQSGSVWNVEFLDLNLPFDFTFDVYLGTKNGGADGIAFILQQVSTSTGGLGGGMGFQGISPSLGVLLDTYTNAGDPAADPNNTWDPASGADHISINKNGDVVHGTANELAGPTNLPNIEDGKYHRLRVTWDPVTFTYRAYFDGTLYFTVVEDIVNTIFGGTSDVFWGFTGSTGGLNNDQRFCLALKPDFKSSITGTGGCIGDTIVFTDTTRLFGHIIDWTWDFGDGDSAFVQHPVHVFDSAGVYPVTLRVTDNNGCPADTTLSITILEKPVAQATTDTLTCLENPVTIDASGTTGSGALTYRWTGPGIVSGANSTAPRVDQPGTYYFTVESVVNGCRDSIAVEVPIDTLSPPTDAGPDMEIGCDATTVILQPNTQATDSTVIRWSGPGISGPDNVAAIEVDQAGLYIMNITLDRNGCMAEDTVLVDKSEPITGMVFETTNTICGQSNGRVGVTSVSGGTPAFRYNFNGQGFGPGGSFTNIAAGTYTLSVMDANGCTTDTVVTIENESGVSGFDLAAEPGLCGEKGGLYVTNPVGGTAPMAYSIDGANYVSDSVFTELDSADYTVYVQDANGCVFSQEITLQNFPAPAIMLDSVSPISCKGAEDGEIFTTVTGHYPLNIRWNTTPGTTGDDLLDMGPGHYTCTVTDTNQCSAVLSVSVAEPDSLELQLSTTKSACTDATGTATVTISGGTSPHSIAWETTPVQQDPTATGLTGGQTYPLHVTDARGCKQDTSVSIGTVNGPSVQIASFTNVTCADSTNGRITATANSGTPPYAYSWNTVPEQNTATASELNAGTYTVTITDDAGCAASTSQSITRPDPITATLTVTDDPCGQFKGTIAVSATGGTGSLNYSWNTSPVQQAARATGLDSGVYVVTVQDANQCVAVFRDTVKNLPPPVITQVQITPVTCQGGNDGSITVSAAGNGVLSYSWNTNPVQTSTRAAGLTEGTYQCTVTDTGGCTSDTIVTMGYQYPIPVFSLPAGLVFCEGDSVWIDPQESADSYLWAPNGESTPGIYAASAGLYSLTITRNGCSYTDQAQVTEDQLPAIELGPDQIFCGAVNAAFDISVSGSAQYLWNTGSTQPTETFTQADTVWARITRGTCVVSDTTGLYSQTPVQVSLPDDTVLCEGAVYEIVPAVANASNPDYSWSSGETSERIAVNNTGLYSVTVIDGICSATDQMQVNFLEVPHVDLGSDSALCAGETIVLSSGYPQFDNQWGHGVSDHQCDVNTNGTYWVEVRNQMCADRDSVDITIQPLPVFSIGTDTIICPRESVTIGAALPDAAYRWNRSPETSPFITVGQTGLYVLSITQGHCTQSDSLWLAHHPLPDIPETDITKCYLDTILVDVSCAECVAYKWDNGDTLPVIIVPHAMQTDVTVVNVHGCTAEQMVTVRDERYGFCDPRFFVANAFTPDADGLNEIFTPVFSHPELLRYYELQVYNRWGELVFESGTLDLGWRGDYHGSRAQDGMYNWTIRYKLQNEAENRQLWGRVILIR